MTDASEFKTMGRKMTFFIKNMGPAPFLHFVRLMDELGDRAERVVFVGSGTGFHESGLATVARSRGLDVFVVDPDPSSFAQEGEEVLLEPTHADISELPTWDQGTILVMFWPNPSSTLAPHTWDADALKVPHDASLVFFGPDGSSGSKNLLFELAGRGEYSLPLRSCHSLFVGEGQGLGGMTLVLQSHLVDFEGESDQPEPKQVPMPKGDMVFIAHRTLSTLAMMGEPDAFMMALADVRPLLEQAGLMPAES